MDSPGEASIRHELDEHGIAHVIFDRAGSPVNLLSQGVLESLDGLLRRLAERHDIRGLLFRSAKPGMFLAGTDLREVAPVTDAYLAAEASRFGQAVFQRIAQAGIPSACAIDGVCLGSGVELALACTFRIAGDGADVRIGFPEVRLGLIPGFGGTQRLPRLIGLSAAVDLLLSGRRLGGHEAKRIGLVDRVVPSGNAGREALGLLRRADDDLDGTVAEVARSRGRQSRVGEKVGFVRRFHLGQARQRAARSGRPSDYPAPFRAIEALEAAVTQPLPHGLDLEARFVGELAPSRTCKNLIWLSRARSAMRKRNGRFGALARKVKRAGVVGAGVMGAGICRLLADLEIPVRLRDPRQEALLSALRAAHDLWTREVDRGRMTPRERSWRMGFIAPTRDESGFRRADVVVEAATEDLEVKREIVSWLDDRLDERAVIASNTDSLSIASIASGLVHPERVLGLHFFHPVHRRPLVEIVAGPDSSPEALATVRDLVIRLGKTPVVVRDNPGFLVNRIQMAFFAEALRLLHDGVRIEACDRAAELFGMPEGPFALLDRVGLEAAAGIGRALETDRPGRVGDGIGILEAMIESGRAGEAAGRGFYRYRGGRKTTPDPATYEVVGRSPDTGLPLETLQERLVLAMVNEAVLCLEERVVTTPEDLDLAVVLGTGFPAFRGGLLRYSDGAGVIAVTDRLSRLAEAHGDRFRPADMLREMARDRRRFYPEG